MLNLFQQNHENIFFITTIEATKINVVNILNNYHHWIHVLLLKKYLTSFIIKLYRPAHSNCDLAKVSPLPTVLVHLLYRRNDARVEKVKRQRN